jgi:hypothetical protein
METQNFDKVKKEFIVDQEEYSKSQLSKLMSILLNFCKITRDGQVIIMKKIATRKILKLILSARFVAHAADDSIHETITREELKAYSRIKDAVFTTRFNDMLRENFAEKKDNVIKAKNILLIEQFLEKD